MEAICEDMCAGLPSRLALPVTWGKGEQTDFWFHSGVFFHSLCCSKGHLFPIGEEDGRDQSKLETKVWEAHNPLVDKQIDQFLVVAR